MEKMTKAFLIFCSIALLPIALSYGAKPASSLNMLYGIVVDTTNLSHIMRAVMGLYLGMILIWLLMKMPGPTRLSSTTLGTSTQQERAERRRIGNYRNSSFRT